jgi:hypothetical protein
MLQWQEMLDAMPASAGQYKSGCAPEVFEQRKMQVGVLECYQSMDKLDLKGKQSRRVSSYLDLRRTTILYGCAWEASKCR